MRAKEQCFFKIFSELRVRNITFIVVRKSDRSLEEFSFVDDMDILCKRVDREKIIEAGCDHYISKPIDPEQLLKDVEKWLK